MGEGIGSMSGFTKLDASIVMSTVWDEPDPIRIVWITMLALADATGRVDGSVPGLARVARVPIEACAEALQKFEQPDKFSRTPDHDGRRIASVDGGWQLLNYDKYRQKRDPDERRQQVREATARWRDRQISEPNVNTVNSVSRSEPRAEGRGQRAEDPPTPLEQGSPKRRRGSRRGTGTAATTFPEDFAPNQADIAKAERLSLDVSEQCEAFRDKSLSRGWTYVDWHAGFRTWLTNARKFADADQASRSRPQGGIWQ